MTTSLLEVLIAAKTHNRLFVATVYMVLITINQRQALLTMANRPVQLCSILAAEQYTHKSTLSWRGILTFQLTRHNTTQHSPMVRISACTMPMALGGANKPNKSFCKLL